MKYYSECMQFSISKVKIVYKCLKVYQFAHKIARALGGNGQWRLGQVRAKANYTWDIQVALEIAVIVLSTEISGTAFSLLNLAENFTQLGGVAVSHSIGIVHAEGLRLNP